MAAFHNIWTLSDYATWFAHSRGALKVLQSELAFALEAADRGNYELCIDRVRMAQRELDFALGQSNAAVAKRDADLNGERAA